MPGCLILIGGDPGIGKSTLLLQAAAAITQTHSPVLYVSGEESAQQIRIRGERLGIEGKGLYIFTETDLDSILAHLEEVCPKLVIIDSIQTIFSQDIQGAAGSVGQVRENTLRLMQWAKAKGISVFISGHVTKEGNIAGPRMLEHIVDVVLYLEGEPYSSYRLLRSVKNRFGSTNEVGIFEMGDKGMREVQNPSATFLSERSPGAIGSAIVPAMEGTRPLLVEIQALTSATGFTLPRRTVNGVEFNRLLLIIAVLSKRLGLTLSNQDVIVNVAGGLKVSEPAADLGIALALVSSIKNMGLHPDLVATGEIGLSGELRSISQMERRLKEAEMLGFRRCILPASAAKALSKSGAMELIGAKSVSEAIKLSFPRAKPREARQSAR